MSNTLYFLKPGEIAYLQITIKPLYVRPSRIRDMLFELLKLAFLLEVLLKTGPPNLCILGGYLKQVPLFYTNILTYAQA